MMPRDVLHVLATAQEKGAGIGRMVRAFALALDPGRYRVHAWFLGGDGVLAAQFRAAAISVRTFQWNGDRRDVTGLSTFWRRLRKEHFSIVHTHFGGRAVPFLVRSALRTKIVLHLHAGGAESGDPGPIVVRPWAADRVVAVSRAVARVVVGPQPNVVYYGIEIPDEGRPFPLPVGGRPLVLGTAGRLVPIKGVVHLIRALALLRHEFPEVHLEVAGAGPEQTTLHEEATALGLAECITFVGWHTPIWPLFARWDIFVQPSLDDASPMAVIEAMAAGLPVVGTSVGGLPELIDDGRTGYVVPPADAPALAGRCRDLLLDTERRRAMGDAGQVRARERFSVDRMAAELTGIYDQLLGANG